MLWSVLVHGAISLSVLALVHYGSKGRVENEFYVDLGYEVFDAPPQPTQQKMRVVKTQRPIPPPEVSSARDEASRELQDERSEVAGTQEAKGGQTASAQGGGDAASTPFYKIKPQYPRAALRTGVEGWVLLEIDIAEDGSVENVRVIDGEQRSIFQSEARRAVAKWKYRPFLDQEGKVYRKLGHQVRVDFKLNQIL